MFSGDVNGRTANVRFCGRLLRGLKLTSTIVSLFMLLPEKSNAHRTNLKLTRSLSKLTRGIMGSNAQDSNPTRLVLFKMARVRKPEYWQFIRLVAPPLLPEGQKEWAARDATHIY